MVRRNLPHDGIEERHFLSPDERLGVAYQTAWYLCHSIRAVMRDMNSEPLRGIVEVGETNVGGKSRRRGHGFMRAFASAQRSGFVEVLTQGDKWLRVTDVVWRADAVPGIPLGALGDVRTVTNGVALHLNGPTMTRGLRQVSLTVVPADLQGHSETILPIGFSPFLHCWSLDQPGHEIPLANTGGYATIQRALPVGAELLFKAITPAWQSLVTWFSMAASVLGGIALLASGSGRSLPWPGTTKASTDSGEMTPGRNGTKLRPI